jgi:hypothetical protein
MGIFMRSAKLESMGSDSTSVTRRRLLEAAAGSGTVLLAGCGGNGSSTTDGPTDVTDDVTGFGSGGFGDGGYGV